MQLPDIDHSEDIKKYQAREIKTNVTFTHCTHANIQLNATRTELRCPCGVAFTGSRLGELKALLLSRQ